MKTGLTIKEMAQELLRQSKAKQDYLVNTGSLSLSVASDVPQLRVTEEGTDKIAPLDIRQTAHRQQQGEKHPPADERENGDHDTDEKRDTAPKGRFFFHFSCHLSKIIWKTKKEEPRMCPESLKTHHAVPLFHFAGIRLFRQAFPISVHDLHRRQRRPGSAGALLSRGSSLCTG